MAFDESLATRIREALERTNITTICTSRQPRFASVARILKQLPNDRWYIVGQLGTECSAYSTKQRLVKEYPDIEFRAVDVKLYARLKVKE